MTQTVEGMTDAMRVRVANAQTRMDEISELMSTQEVVTDARRLQSLGREQAVLAPIIERGRSLIEIERQLDDNRALLDEADPELLELLRPRDPNDERDVIMEIRAGTGGDEAALFAADLLRMYLRYAETRGWKAEMLSTSETDIGGLKEVIVE